MAFAGIIVAGVLLLLSLGVVRLCKRISGKEISRVLMELAIGIALFGLVFVLYR